jgi:hypothetical protein
MARRTVMVIVVVMVACKILLFAIIFCFVLLPPVDYGVVLHTCVDTSAIS